MNIPSKYNPASTEEKWYQYWMEKGFFHSEPDKKKESYTIVIPPPNVTGVLHMGHMLNNTIQDIMVRRERMLGKNALWVPGTDHASIATEARVVARLREKGIKKSDLSREEFMDHAWEWRNEHGGIILEQLKKLGASCDWERTKFTMDDDMYESVIDVFIDLFNKGFIYRGKRMVNWDPQAKTAISDEEVIFKEVDSKLYYFRYKIDGKDKWVEIATTRPETILGDTAVCVHPDDERFKDLHGKRVLIPLVNRSVPIITDEHVDPEFGTGALKITPAHDENDYEIGRKHSLEIIDIFNDDGTLNKSAQFFVGEDRFEVRDKITKKLDDEGHLVKVEDYVNKVGYSERTDVAIEPKLSLQWFLRMKELAQPALEHVMNDDIKIYPKKFKNTYRYWMENVRDWCISRQLWWGQRIPAYYIGDDDTFVIAKTREEALVMAKEKTGNMGLKDSDLKQDEDVLDTWFSSWLWPISVFDGIRNPDNEDIRYYYPTNDLITAPDILFFWVARMIIAGYEYLDEKPFHNVYLTGMVRDNMGRKMSKSLGNSPDPLELIKKYGADGVRVGMLLCSPAGGDLLFDESLTEQGRNFCNKIWNAFRLIKSFEVDEDLNQPDASAKIIQWFDAKLNEAIKTLEKQFTQYRLSEALMTVYKLFWDEFASWYLEIIKPSYKQPIDSKTFEATTDFFEKLLKILHPFIPFITEEIWQKIKDRPEGSSIMVSSLPSYQPYDNEILNCFSNIKEVVSFIRKTRKDNNISKDIQMLLYVKPTNKYDDKFDKIITKLENISEIIFNKEPRSDISAGYINKYAEYDIPISDYINTSSEIKKMKDDLEYTRDFLRSVMKKLNNEQFIQNAPKKVVQRESAKKSEAEEKIKVLEERIAGLK